MPGISRLTAVGLLGGLLYLGAAPNVAAQRPLLPITSPLALAGPTAAAFAGPDSTPAGIGTIAGTVRSDEGEPVEGVVVTAVGATTTFTVTDERGVYELSGLTPGPYMLRAHSSGYLTPRPRTIEVRPNSRTLSSFGLRKAETTPTILAAGIGPVTMATPEPRQPTPDAPETAAADEASGESIPDDHSETAWRLRHVRRGVLRDVSLPGDLRPAEDDDLAAMAEHLGRALRSPARVATSFFADAPWTGQVNLLTTNLFDAPQQLLSGAGPVRGIAYIKLGAPVGQHADWTVRGALNDGDLSSWVIAGAYQTRGPARRTRDIRLSYSTQRYEGGHPLALREVTDGSRNAGSLYAFETFSVSPSLSVAYGARYERFDYLDERNLVSPRAEITLRPLAHTRVSMALSSRADAPGAQEFLPPSDEGIWLPPQRTFSSARPGTPLRPERANQVSASLEREWGPMTVALRAFRQDVDDQMATVFGTDVPEFPGTRLGHYVLGTAGDVDARGGAVAVRADLGSRFRGSIAYSQAVARMTPITDVSYLLLLAPSTVRARQERLHDVTATVQAEVPETSTRVLILYRVGIGYARPGVVDDPGVDSRFDVQVRQSLPFLNFTSARWEMLIAIRNSFRDVTGDQSIYDELLTVQAPKRLIGGVSLLF